MFHVCTPWPPLPPITKLWPSYDRFQIFSPTLTKAVARRGARGYAGGLCQLRNCRKTHAGSGRNLSSHWLNRLNDREQHGQTVSLRQLIATLSIFAEVHHILRLPLRPELCCQLSLLQSTTHCGPCQNHSKRACQDWRWGRGRRGRQSCSQSTEKVFKHSSKSSFSFVVMFHFPPFGHWSLSTPTLAWPLRSLLRRHSKQCKDSSLGANCTSAGTS
jgi:hypothetical protein